MYKTFIIVALVLGVFAWYLRFMQEASELEGFTDSNDTAIKIKSIMKRVDEETEISNKKKVSFKQVRSLAGETADKWSIFALFDNTTEAVMEVFRTVLKTFVAPFLHRIERLFL